MEKDLPFINATIISVGAQIQRPAITCDTHCPSCEYHSSSQTGLGSADSDSDVTNPVDDKDTLGTRLKLGDQPLVCIVWDNDIFSINKRPNRGHFDLVRSP